MDAEAEPTAPESTSFFAQNYPMKRFDLTPRLYIAVFSPFGLLCLVMGTVLLFSRDSTIEVKQEYGSKCPVGETCRISVSIPSDMTHPIALMFELTNFYQNHWHSMKSRSDQQLLGEYVRYDEMKSCLPYRAIDDDPSPNKWILPCGLQAVSFFNDSFEIEGLTTLSAQDYQASGIIPNQLNSMYVTGNMWLKSYSQWQGSNVQKRFGQWMDTIAFPNFRRVWGLTSETGKLESGNITIQIESNFNASAYQGEKSIVLATSSYYPPCSQNLGIMYLVFGTVMELAVIVALLFKPKLSETYA